MPAIEEPGHDPSRAPFACTLRVRAVSDEEKSSLTQLARSRTRGAGLVRRAQIIVHAVEGLSAPAIGAKMELCGHTVRFWLKRFNERGLQGLEEDLRSGRPVTGMRRSRISEILLDEGLKWRQEETWFGERVDPDFATKRGRSSSSTPRRRLVA